MSNLPFRCVSRNVTFQKTRTRDEIKSGAKFPFFNGSKGHRCLMISSFIHVSYKRRNRSAVIKNNGYDKTGHHRSDC
jgi:hypothetical protein